MKNRNVEADLVSVRHPIHVGPIHFGQAQGLPLRAADVRRMIPRRSENSYKNKNGHVLLVAGSRGMSGAAVLSGLGALRVGAGLLTVGIVQGERRPMTTRLPEAMTLPLPETRDGVLAARASSLLHRFSKEHRLSVVAVGPGLSQRGAVKKNVRTIVRTWKLPIVLDADGLNVMRPQDFPHGLQMVITPHPGELARLLGVSREAIEKARVKMAQKTARELGVVCVLKGHKTVISDGRRTAVNTTGNSAMATGGMGDVLTGIIAGLLAQGLSLFDAACAGVYLHGLAGDLAAVGDRGLLASELATYIPKALKRVIAKD